MARVQRPHAGVIVLLMVVVTISGGCRTTSPRDGESTPSVSHAPRVVPSSHPRPHPRPHPRQHERSRRPPDDLRRVAVLFLRFARGRLPGIPADNPVDLYVGGVLVRTIASEDQHDRRAWQECPSGGMYAGHTCPISALAPFARWRGRIAVSTDPPSHPCAHPTPLPRALHVYRSITLTPAADLDCTAYFADELFVNDVGQVVAVEVVWAEP